MERHPLPSAAAFSALPLLSALLLSAPSLAQDRMARADAGPGDCTPSAQAHECADRCPSYDTCIVASGGGQLYYRVGDQRFDCAGLDCGMASQSLGDYCCQRGAFAPGKGGDGCAQASSPRTASLPWLAAAAALASARLLRRRRTD